MKRRNFNKYSALAALGLPLIQFQAACKEVKNNKYMDDIGLQLWTVRNELAKDAVGTLKAIADAGYKQIELMNLDMYKELSPIAKDLGLDIRCSHVNWTYFTERWDLKNMPVPDHGPETLIEQAVKAGISHLVFAYWFKEERNTLDDYKNIAEKLNSFGSKCADAGIKMSYHNHSFEFKDLGGGNGFDVLINEFDPNFMQFELDVFWASIAGVEPVELMKKMKGKINLLHLKDKLKNTIDNFDEGAVPHEAFKELGNGVVDIKGIIEIAESTGVDYCLVEQDQSPDPIQSTRTSMQYLQGLG